MLGNIATLAMKAQLCAQFFFTFPLVQHFIKSECTGGRSVLQVITRKRLRLFHASGLIHYAKLVNLCHLKMCTLQDEHGHGWIPFLHRGRLLYHPMQGQVLGGVWSDMTTKQVLTRTKMVSGGLTWGCKITEKTLAKLACASLYTIVFPWGAQWQLGWVLWAVLLGNDTVKTWDQPIMGRFGVVHVEHRSSSTALWALSWRSQFTVFWHYWRLLSELPQFRESRPAASTVGGWKKLHYFQKWRGRLRGWL